MIVSAPMNEAELRDLMYVARPPEPRPRYCQPDEVVRFEIVLEGSDAVHQGRPSAQPED